MSIASNDLQPKPFNINIKGNDYKCNPLRMSHRIIIAKISPLFAQFEIIANGQEIEMSTEKIFELEKELDLLINNLIPELKNIELNIEDLANLIGLLMDSILPQESQDLKDAKVEVNNDPKVETEQT